MTKLISLEICAGGGGQALGLEWAGFNHAALVEIDKAACDTLSKNRPNWQVFDKSVLEFSAKGYKGIDLLAGGVPCPPFSKAGKQLGPDDERDLFPEALRLVEECNPRAVMLENVRGLLDPIFDDYRETIANKLRDLGYVPQWQLLKASDFGVSQLRPRAILVAIKNKFADNFSWPMPQLFAARTVGDILYDLMAEKGWRGVDDWRRKADSIAPTIVGGSKKHGGPDLGPTRAKQAWATLGVDGHGVANEAPAFDFVGRPRLTVRMIARIQGFPDDWAFSQGKTAAFRQVGNAFPPPVAYAVAKQIHACLLGQHSAKVFRQSGHASKQAVLMTK
jgi:DNA (cytosine-5)-methyltransferase 1